MKIPRGSTDPIAPGIQPGRCEERVEAEAAPARSRWVIRFLVVFAAVVAAATLTACVPKPVILVYGDSLVVEADGGLRLLMDEAYDVRIQGFGGAALCDSAERIVADARAIRPRMVVMAFSGNAFSPCMRPAGGVPGNMSWWAAKYEADANSVVSRLGAMGVSSTLVGSPPTLVRGSSQPAAGIADAAGVSATSAGVDMAIVDADAEAGLAPAETVGPSSLAIGQIPGGYIRAESFVNAVYQRVVIGQRARGADVGFLDGGRFLRSPGGGWTGVLGCLSWEDASRGCTGGLIPVRSPDFMHFCPTTFGFAPGCSTYSSGAWRYATGITAYVDNRLKPTVGSLDIVTSVGDERVTVGGWALDPDADESPIAVHVYSDGAFAGAWLANKPRPDVKVAYPWSGSNHGFHATFPIAPGVRQVCVYAINVGAGSVNPLLGCKTVVVPAEAPVGNLDFAVGVSGGIRVAGWTADYDAPRTPLAVHVYVGPTFSGAMAANLRRTDIGRIFPVFGDNHGFDGVVPANPGTQLVCAYAINVGAGSVNPLLGCKTVTVPPA